MNIFCNIKEIGRYSIKEVKESNFGERFIMKKKIW